MSNATVTLPDHNEYKLYVLAQLHVLKLQRAGDVHALIGPHILVGDKAWKRWRLWKKYYDQQREKPRTEEELAIKDKASRVLIDLRRTKEFLIKEGITSVPLFLMWGLGLEIQYFG